ncbi:hypothetical protein FNF29_05883 [Cafeteria roenbergensis]|uniref:Uncharacterized protein n=1 Tax=Cafeteria roenbergensis TaxID=33653 RepID=A0A5A8DI65_CAFRO|nr:hypothetical protein FNF29_05883 [Cafeteria roenbergensis]KAA0157829.1 hypothetical protein FNF31_05727 [Cafeteria roenbergensis]KAA0164789.1 hypothetical protein FNF28_03676 [Cafeteria roenbergensis]|eukprot:KAA0149497.1 hypothetical protein FNF29_05883 [Cafeteria roenbergensis]
MGGQGDNPGLRERPAASGASEQDSLLQTATDERDASQRELDGLRKAARQPRGNTYFQCGVVQIVFGTLAGVVAVSLIGLEVVNEQLSICKPSAAIRDRQLLALDAELMTMLRGLGWLIVAALALSTASTGFGLPFPPVVLSDWSSPAPWPVQKEGDPKRLSEAEIMRNARLRRFSMLRDIWRPGVQVALTMTVVGAGVWAAVDGIPVVGVAAGTLGAGDPAVIAACSSPLLAVASAVSDGCILVALLYLTVLSLFACRACARRLCPDAARACLPRSLEEAEEERRNALRAQRQAARLAEAEERAEALAKQRVTGVEGTFGGTDEEQPPPGGAGSSAAAMQTLLSGAAEREATDAADAALAALAVKRPAALPAAEAEPDAEGPADGATAAAAAGQTSAAV